ncbi:hypothetical protein QBO85_000297 [Acinetobacter baumannii]|nr:hypothetical protein [Acinetobacter baumannii]
MKPEQFIREQGLDAVKDCIEEAKAYGGLYVNAKTLELSKHIPSYDAVSIIELMRLVESLALVNCFDDLEQAKSWVSDMNEDFPYVFKGDTYDNRFYKHELVTAIADHESIYGGGDA